MQSNWGPRVFWLVVFLLGVAGVFVYFYEPPPELGRPAVSGTVENVLTISPKLAGFELRLDPQPSSTNDWKGSVLLAQGKIVQLYPVSRVGEWSQQGNRYGFRI